MSTDEPRNGETSGEMLGFGVLCGSGTASHPGTELFSRAELDGESLHIEVEKLNI
jgi:fructose-1-phosphate kinase PfkB-like protein